MQPSDQRQPGVTDGRDHKAATMGRLTALAPRIAASNSERVRRAAKVADSFYKTKEWAQARAESIARHFGRCAHCDRRPERLFVDHIVELKDGGAALDQSNLEPLCGSCHTAKTAKARGERMRRPAG